MDKKTLKQIGKDLLSKKKKIEKELKKFAKKSDYNPQDYNAIFPEFGDRIEENANEVAAYGDSLALERALEAMLKDINNALTRIKEGNYGVCKYCHQEIPLQRLLVRPASGSCVACKERMQLE